MQGIVLCIQLFDSSVHCLTRHIFLLFLSCNICLFYIILYFILYSVIFLYVSFREPSFFRHVKNFRCHPFLSRYFLFRILIGVILCLEFWKVGSVRYICIYIYIYIMRFIYIPYVNEFSTFG
jgi:hypothetical protein